MDINNEIQRDKTLPAGTTPAEWQKVLYTEVPKIKAYTPVAGSHQGHHTLETGSCACQHFATIPARVLLPCKPNNKTVNVILIVV